MEECRKTDSMVKSSVNFDTLLSNVVGIDGINGHWKEETDQTPSLLVESLFISHNISPELKKELKEIVKP